VGSSLEFWDNLAPYLSHIEDNFLDLESINKLKSIIKDPVLIVGAGQGLLVESLQQNGYNVDGIDNNPKMIEYAEKRRGIKLIQEDATNLSFNDNSYGATIIATGVVDYIDDTQLIEKILNEAVRVTTDDGKVLVAFYRIHPASEAFQKRAGILTIDGKFRHQYAFGMMRSKPTDMIKTIKKDAHMGLLSIILHLVKMQVLVSKKERDVLKSFNDMFNIMDDPIKFIESCPDSIPYRTLPAIQTLFEKLGFSISNTYVYDSCTVAEIDNSEMQ
jgi:ubiquinone/menaquinone biosynthesis C-methylase UbiE